MIHDSSRLPLWLPVCVGCGIALYFAQGAPTPFWPYALGLVIAGALCLRLWRYAIPRLMLLAGSALLLGALSSFLRLQVVDAPVLRAPIFFKMVEGTVEDIQHKEKKTKLFLHNVRVETLAPEETPKRISVSVKTHQTPQPVRGDVKIGDRIALPSMLFPPPAPALPGAYDFARMFYFEQLGAVGFSPRQPSPSPAGGGSGWGHLEHNGQNSEQASPPPNLPPAGGGITALRLAIADHLVAVMGEEAGAIAGAMMVGEQSRVSEEISDSMRASGIYHILSISGLHMSLATGLIFFAARLLLAMIPYTALHWPNKKIAAVCGLIGGAAYLLLAGSPVPAVRSYIMVACVLFAVLADRKGISMFSLAWAATIILLILPESIFTASFQLSFAATLAIVALYERYGGVLFYGNAGLLRRFVFYFLGLMLTSLAATLYTSPLAIFHFNRVAIYGVLANMLVVPLSSFWIMPLALMSMIAMPLGWDTSFLYLLKVGIDWMMAGSRFFASFPYASITLPAPSAVGILLIVVGGLWFALWTARLRLLGLGMIIAGLATIVQFQPYDMIISDDAKRIAYRSASGQWVMLRGDVDSFEAEMWLRAQGEETMLSRSEALGKVKELRCDKTTCMVERGGKMIIVSFPRRRESIRLNKMDPRIKSKDDICESGAEVVIADRYLTCDNISHVIDRGFVAQHGATGLRFADGVIEVNTTQAQRGRWPWVVDIEVIP